MKLKKRFFVVFFSVLALLLLDFNNPPVALSAKVEKKTKTAKAETANAAFDVNKAGDMSD